MESTDQCTLSAAQAGVWYAQQLDPGNPNFVTGQCIDIVGELDPALLARAVDLVAAQSPELSTRVDVVDGEPVQVPGGHRIPPTGIVPAADRESALADMRSRLRVPVDLRIEPGFGAAVYVLGPDRHALLLRTHHALLDVYGYSLLGRRIAAVHNALKAGTEPPAPRFDAIGAVVAEESDYAASARFAADREFWIADTRGAPDAPTLALAPAPPAAALAHDLRHDTVAVTAQIADRLDELGRAAGGGWADAVTAAIAGYLARTSGETDITLGFPSMNRMGSAAARVLTVAVNIAPLRVTVDPGAGVADLTRSVREAVARTQPYTRYRSEDMHRDLRLPAAAPGPVGPAVNIKPFGDTLRFDGATATVHSLARGPIRDISFVVRRLDETRALEIQIDADADRYTAADLQRHARGLTRLLESAVGGDPALARVDLLDEAHRVGARWSGAVAVDECPDVLDAVDRQVAARPDATALVCGPDRWTYADLARRVDALATDLAAHGAGPELLVALALPRTVDVVVALLAVLRTGAGYIPLDPQFPAARLEYMLADARPAILLTTGGFTDRVAVPANTVTGVLSDGHPTWAVEPGVPVAGTVGPGNTAYVIYTSGSTGNPKGVVLDRRALARFVSAATDSTGIDSDTRLLAVTTLSFDIAVLELFVPLCAGGTVILADDDAARDPAAVAALLSAESVTAVQATPSLWGAVLDQPGADLSSVAVLVGGEALPAPVAAGLAARARSVTNMYGPTEATVWCTSTPVDADRAWTGSIGRPFPGTAAFVLDRFLHLVPAGVVGELYVAGAQLARGYRGRGGLTAARFVANPFGPGRLYRTGDLVRWSADGELEYLGRGDDQVKVRGHRIELGEIETVAARFPAVAAAVAVARPDPAGTVHLVGYVTAVDGDVVDTAALRDFLAAELPAYMVPSALVVLSEFPLTPNLKVDRKALPAPDFGDVDTGRGADSATELALSAMFADLLALDAPGVDADFFTLGGTSLSATRLVARIAGTLGADLSLRDVFDHPTISGLAVLVDAAVDARSPMTVVPRGETMALSAAQQRLWFLHNVNGPSATYNVPFALRIRGRVDEHALRRALAAVVARHEVLRTVVVDQDGLGVARILPSDTAVAFRCADVPADDLDRALVEAAAVPFDLATETPLRAHLLRTSALESVLLLVIHHLAGDEWSAGPLLSDLAAAYAGADLPDDPGRLQYADFAAWQHARPTSPDSLDFWRTALAGVPEELALPYDRPRPPVPSQRGAEVWLHTDAALAAGLRALASETGTTVFMAVQAAVAVLLYRVGGGADIVLGAPVAGRGAAGVEDLVGLFVDTVALRVDLSGDPTLRSVLDRVRRTDLDAFAHQDTQFEDVVDAAGVTRSLSRHPLFQTLVQHRTPHVAPVFAGLEVDPSYVSTGTAKFDLTFEFVESEDGLNVRLEYALDLFDRGTAEALAQRLRAVLEAFVTAPDGAASDVDVLLPAERAAFAPVAETEPRHLLPALLDNADREFADRVAVVAGPDRRTYRELADRANRLARTLIDRGIGPDSIVAIAAERSLDLVVALRAVIAAGAAYLPIDLDYPQARIGYMLADAAPDLVLVDAVGAARIVTEAPVAVLADLAAASLARSAGPVEDSERTGRVGAANLAYLVYTSGSTGQPKGVPGTVAALTNRLSWQRDLLGGADADVRLAKSSFSFIDGSTELLAGLLSGARLVLADDADSRDVAALAGLIAEHRVNLVTAVPSLAAALAESGAHVPRWFLSGEPLEIRVVRALGDAAVHNSYGSSEVAGDVNVWAAAGSGRVLIGAPVPGVGEYVLDARLRPVPDGVVGELYVGGVQLARGYLGRPGLTAARFVADPAGSGRRLFRTGDLVRRTGTGELAFVSRADNQLSLRGFRIEPGEVEAALATRADVERALVTVRGDQLVGYVVTAAEPTDADLRSHLRNLLPDYMIPSVFVVLPALPTLPNGKVDRDALPAPTRAEHRRAPATEIEEHFCSAVADLLGLPSVGPDEDFFALGGNSLLATRLCSAIRSRTGREVSIREVFDLRTPALLAAETAALSTRAPLLRREHPELVPMSAAQRRLWFLHQLEGPSPTYNIPFTMRLRGTVDVPALRAALAHVLGVHESLRTVFTAGDTDDGHIGYQKVLPAPDLAVDGDVPLTVADVDPAALGDRLVRETAYPFDITTELPVRAVLLRTSPDDAHLLLLVHHIAADEWSARPLIADLAAAYTHVATGAGELPGPLAVQYRDFSAWQPEVLGDAADPASVVSGQLDHWVSVLTGQPEEIALPLDRTRPAVSTYRGSAVGFEIGSETARALRSVAADSGATMFMLTHAAVAVLLRELGAGDDVVVGSPVAGRSDAALDRLVGFFVNTLVLRTDLGGNPTFAEVLRRVRTADLDAYAHQDVPFEQLVERMAPARSLSRQPLFQVLVQYRDRIDPVVMAGLDVTPVFVETGTSKFDLTFELAEAVADPRDPSAVGGVRGRIEYASDLFDRATVESFAGRLVRLLEQIAENPDTRLSEHDLLTEGDRAALALGESGRTVAVDEATLPELFARQARTTPGALAVVVDETGEQLTYAQLDAAVDALAAHLTVASGSVIAVSVRRSAALVVALLAIHRVGAAYLPLDDSYPRERLEYMVADARPALMLVGPGVQAVSGDAPVLEIDAAGRVPGPAAPPVDPPRVHPDAAAYLLYTSGSTGRPKGVLVGHRAIANRLAWMQAEYGLAAADRVLQKTPSGFDVSVWEFFWPLITGAALVMARPDGHRDPQYLREVIDRRSVTTAHFVPSMLAAFLDAVAETGGPRPTLTRVLCSGEALATEHRDRFHALVDAQLHNLYGPTEAAVDVTATPIEPHRGDGPGWVPIGRPVWNTRVLVLDERLRRVPPGVAGELYLGGVQLARGYHDRPALTADRFVADPYTATGERLYRTGDLVRLRPATGGPALEYLGRTDTQVKLRGLRVELGEIEAVLLADESVAQSAVVARSGRLYGYVVPAAGAAVDVPTLIASASMSLPDHMVPAAVVVLDALPLSANGKLDRRALPEPETPSAETRRAPDGPAETAMCELFAEALQLDEVGADDDFFMLGGDSIVSIQVVNAAARRGVTFGPREIFQWRTPAALARAAEFDTAAEDVGSASGPRDPAQWGPVPLTPLVHRARETGREPAGLGAAVTVATPVGASAEGVRAALGALIDTHDALRLRLTRVASVLWSLDTGAAVDVESILHREDATDDEPAQQVSDEAAALVAGLDPEAGRTLAATWIDAAGRPGVLVVAVHAFAADTRSLGVLRADLDALVHGRTVARPAATAHGLAHRINDRAQDPALMAELAHWSQVLAPGAGLRAGVPALPSVDPARAAVDATVVLDAVPGPDRSALALAALATAVAQWRGEPGELAVEVERVVERGGDEDPDATRTVGPFVSGVPVRVGDPSVAAVRSALDATPSGYGLLRYLGAQTAPVFVTLARPEVALRVVDANAPVQAVVDPRQLEVTVAFAADGSSAHVTVDHDPAQVTAADARTIVDGVAAAIRTLDQAGLSTAR
ncbi:amino acid adenylation domain-containing protein [Rhodococcus sp. NPDC003318]|uniref:amino acid adenylation domain-containing protein n=1 Tax=Rhodococcus sp. NPDC003318 TaxID=3364503 RepID=UPI00369C2419